MTVLVGTQVNSAAGSASAAGRVIHHNSGHVASASGTATKAFCIPGGGSPGSKVKILVYNSAQNTLLATSSEYTYTGSEDGTTGAEMSISLSITSGTTYYLALFCSGSLTYRAETVSGTNWTNATYPTAPSAITTDDGWQAGERPTLWLEDSGAPATTKKLKLLAHSSAASATSIAGVVFNAPTGSDITGSRLGEFTGGAFEATLESGQAVLKVAVADFGGEALTTASTPVALVRNATYTTGAVSCTVIEE